jgi:hypothetical protein
MYATRVGWQAKRVNQCSQLSAALPSHQPFLPAALSSRLQALTYARPITGTCSQRDEAHKRRRWASIRTEVSPAGAMRAPEGQQPLCLFTA